MKMLLPAISECHCRHPEVKIYKLFYNEENSAIIKKHNEYMAKYVELFKIDEMLKIKYVKLKLDKDKNFYNSDLMG